MIVTNNSGIDDVFLRLHERYNKQRQQSIESRESGDPWDHKVSITELINPLQITLLRDANIDNVQTDLNNLLPSILGSAVHEALALTDPGNPLSLAEERLYIEVNGTVVSGQPDRIFKEPNKFRVYKNSGSVWVNQTWSIQDYKFTGAYSTFNPKDEWAQQLNCYAYLARHGKTNAGDTLDLDVKNLFVTAIVRDFNRNNLGRTNYPQSWVVDIEIPLWSEEEQKEFIETKVSEYQNALATFKETGETPKCSEKDRWSMGGGFAVMKPNRKTAVKLFDAAKEAQEYADDIPTAYVESRTVKYNRCANYCDAFKFCEQAMETK